MVDREAQAEAWLRKKPKRIIQNQWLIELLFVLLAVSGFPIGGISMWLIFGVTPLAPMVLFVTWLVSAAIYTSLKLYVWFDERQRGKRLRA